MLVGCDAGRPGSRAVCGSVRVEDDVGDDLEGYGKQGGKLKGFSLYSEPCALTCCSSCGSFERVMSRNGAPHRATVTRDEGYKNS